MKVFSVNKVSLVLISSVVRLHQQEMILDFLDDTRSLGKRGLKPIEPV